MPEWNAVDEAPVQIDELEVEDPTLLAEFVHPVRARLLMFLREPATVAELAARLDVPVTRLYHHIAHLEGLGLVHVSATRRVRSALEKRYRASARGYRIGPAAFADRQRLTQVTTAMLDFAKAELVGSIDAGFDVSAPVHPAALRFERKRMSSDRWRELVDDVVARLDAADDDPDGEEFTLVIAAFPTAETVAAAHEPHDGDTTE